MSDSSTKFTRFGVSSKTCNSDFAVEYSNYDIMNSSFWIDAINLEWPIVYFKGSQAIISK